MKENYTHISVCLDRSGSMASMASEVTEGFNQFVEDQKKEKGKATLSLVKFDDVYESVYSFVNIKDAGKMNLDPGGSTALLDAMGTTLEETRSTVLKMKNDEQPSKVIFVFITDGEENASSKYTRKQIFEMIKDLKTDGANDNSINWQFVFIGANQDAISEGSGYGIRAKSSITFDASGAGAKMAFSSLTKGVSSYRSNMSEAAEYTFEDKDYAIQDQLLRSKSSSKHVNGPIPTSIPDLDDNI